MSNHCVQLDFQELCATGELQASTNQVSGYTTNEEAMPQSLVLVCTTLLLIRASRPSLSECTVNIHCTYIVATVVQNVHIHGKVEC
jgi:hypothetical protein